MLFEMLNPSVWPALWHKKVPLHVSVCIGNVLFVSFSTVFTVQKAMSEGSKGRVLCSGRASFRL